MRTKHTSSTEAGKRPAEREEVRLHFPELIGDGIPDGVMTGTYPSIGVMGELVEAVAESADDPLVTPKPNSNETLNLGMLHSPEGACLPFKLIAGSLIQSMRSGANTVGMITEHGPCRLGMYSLGLRLLLAEAGIDAGWIDFDNTSIRSGYIKRFRELYRRKFNRNLPWFKMFRGFVLGLARLSAVEALEAERNRLLPRELSPGDVEEHLQKGVAEIRAARSLLGIRKTLRQAKAALQAIPLDYKRPTVRVVVTGEAYCVVDPFANGQLERRLAQMGAEPYRVLWQTDYLLQGMKLGKFGHLGGRPAAVRAAKPYISEDLGGDTVANIGHAVMAKERGDYGMLHLKPFACMMEFITENVLRKVSQDLDFPILSLTLDDVNGAERLHVRLEAFVENLFRRQRRAQTMGHHNEKGGQTT